MRCYCNHAIIGQLQHHEYFGRGRRGRQGFHSVFYEFITATKQCIVKKTKGPAPVGCRAGYCPLGKQALKKATGKAGHSYGKGPCIGSIS
ncbi:hypothetical protein AA313_de0208732 [Arthrobotrys entomopaga]|nr:hypothetical protein AA313_de0208732 [Arthrobotrys entomopaga]